MSKMKPAVKRKWVKALRSGKYQQCKGQLRKECEDGKYGYCCLGVLSDLYNKTCKTNRWGKTFRDDNGALSNPVMKWAGLELSDPVVDNEKEDYNWASWFNDEANYNFKEIADLIEKNL